MLGVQGGDGRHKGLGVGVQQVVEEFFGLGLLHHGAQVHDGHLVAQVADHGHLVGDEEHGQGELLPQIHHQVQDLGLDGHVQGGDRLVGHDEGGVQQQGPGDGQTLELTAGHLTGNAVEGVFGEVDLLKQVLDLLLGLIAGDLVDLGHLPQGRADLLLGVEGGVGVLEDHLHVPAKGKQILTGQVGDIPALEVDLASGDGLQTEEGAAQGGLAAAGLTHDAEDAALGDRDGHVADGVEDLLGFSQLLGGDGELLDQVFGANDGLRHGQAPPCPGV